MNIKAIIGVALFGLVCSMDVDAAELGWQLNGTIWFYTGEMSENNTCVYALNSEGEMWAAMGNSVTDSYYEECEASNVKADAIKEAKILGIM